MSNPFENAPENQPTVNETEMTYKGNKITKVEIEIPEDVLFPSAMEAIGLMSLEEQMVQFEQAERFRYFALQTTFREMFHVSLDAFWNLEQEPLHFMPEAFVNEVIVPQLADNPLVPKLLSPAIATEVTFGIEATWIIDKLLGARKLTPEEILVGIANCPEEGPYEAYENVLLVRKHFGLQLLEPTQK